MSGHISKVRLGGDFCIAFPEDAYILAMECSGRKREIVKIPL